MLLHTTTGAVEDDGPNKKGNSSKSLTGKATALAAAAAAKKKAAKSVWQRANKFLFGWTRTTLKINGKKLLPNTVFLARFMVSEIYSWELTEGGGLLLLSV